MPSGFIDRYKGKIYQPTGCLQQCGKGGAVTLGGGQINSSSVIPSTVGAQLSTAGTSETTLMSYVVPAKTLDAPGRNLFLSAFGTFSTANTGAKTARLYFGSEVLALQNSTTVTTLQAWWLMMNIFAQNVMSSAAATQLIQTQTILSSAHGGTSLITGNENTLANSTVKVTGISSSPTAATPGDVTVLSLQVESLN